MSMYINSFICVHMPSAVLTLRIITLAGVQLWSVEEGAIHANRHYFSHAARREYLTGR